MTSTTPPSQPPRRLSIVIPVYNEEAGLAPLFARLYPALDQLGESYEVIFVNDGSRDRSVALLREQFQKRPDVTRVVLFSGNYGQHMAIMAGFAQCRGERVVTLDADADLTDNYFDLLPGETKFVTILEAKTFDQPIAITWWNASAPHKLIINPSTSTP